MPYPATMGPVMGTTARTTDTPAMFARHGWTRRLLILRGREMVLASMAGFLRLRFRDLDSAVLIGKLLLLLWWMSQCLRENQKMDMETQTPKLIKQMMKVTLKTPLLSRSLKPTLMITQTWSPKILMVTVRILLQKLLRKKLLMLPINQALYN